MVGTQFGTVWQDGGYPFLSHVMVDAGRGASGAIIAEAHGAGE